MLKARGIGNLRTTERRLKRSRCHGKEAWLTVLQAA
jgi:hypothetical protein